jgi:predicted RNA-binding protein YlqC (UPF0109 family)
MKELVEFLTKNITGTNDFEVEEKNEDGLVTFIIKAKPEYMGLIIGKGGKTIKTIRNLVKVRATLEKISVNISVEELI